VISIDNAHFFANVTGLTFLSLELNVFLTSIGPGAFDLMLNLTHVEIRSNFLLASITPGVFDNLHHLISLSLRQNGLQKLPSNLLSNATREGLHFFDGSGNSLVQCNCDLKWLAHWMLDKPQVVNNSENADDYTCLELDASNPPNYERSRRIVDMPNWPEQACLLDRTAALLWTIALSLVLGIYTIVILCCCGKSLWKSYVDDPVVFVRQAKKTFLERVKRLVQADYKYDALVAFAEEDDDLVMNTLKPVLEDRLGLRLCIYTRDFHPGKFVVDNIQECAE
jgi:hypothetical protein